MDDPLLPKAKASRWRFFMKHKKGFFFGIVCLIAFILYIIYRITIAEEQPAEEQPAGEQPVGERFPKTGSPYVIASVEIYKENSIEGRNTYRLYLTPSDDIQNIYAIYNTDEEDNLFKIQRSYHVDKPFGSDFKAPSDLLFDFLPETEYDSYITIGYEDEDEDLANLSTIGLDFDQWTETSDLVTDDGMIFAMDPRVENKKINGKIFVGQLTIGENESVDTQFNIQGKMKDGTTAQITGISFNYTH
jgi:hypothetical protein